MICILGTWLSTLSAQSLLRTGIAAVVNDYVITYLDLQQNASTAVELIRRQYANNPRMMGAKLQESLDEALKELVERKLILAEFESSGFNLPESIIDEEIQSQIRDQFGDRATLTKTLQAQGKTFEQYRSDIRERFIVSQMRSFHVRSDVLVSPFKIERYYLKHMDEFKLEDQVLLSMIYLDYSKFGDRAIAVALGSEILRKFEQNTPFEELAAVYSSGASSWVKGQWVDREVLRKDLSDVAFQLKPGGISELLVKDEGAYLLHVKEARVSHIRPLSEVKTEIEETFKSEEIERRRQRWIDRLRDKSYIRYY